MKETEVYGSYYENGIHFIVGHGEVNRNWRQPRLKEGRMSTVKIVRDGFMVILPANAINKDGFIKKSFRIPKSLMEITIERAVELHRKGVSIVAA